MGIVEKTTAAAKKPPDGPIPDLKTELDEHHVCQGNQIRRRSPRPPVARR